DHLSEPALRRLPLRRREALPEEAVIPVLCAVVEDGLVAIGFGLPYDVGQRAAQPLVRDRGVELVDIGLVMLAVMIVERLGGHEIAQRVLRERQIGKRETHGNRSPARRREVRAGLTRGAPGRSGPYWPT